MAQDSDRNKQNDKKLPKRNISIEQGNYNENRELDLLFGERSDSYIVMSGDSTTDYEEDEEDADD
ncbi:MAG: hypothetical protein AAGF83_10745 [Cyanobacteria bacterium P01_G01_bin.67]